MSMDSQTAHDPRLEFDLADRLRRALRVADLPVGDMAEYLGVTRGTVSSWINGRIKPNRQTMRLFAIRTGFPLEWLENGDAPAGNGPDGGGEAAPREIVHPLGLEPRTHWLRAVRDDEAVAA